VSYLRRRNDELAFQLRESRKEESRFQSFLKKAIARAERLNSEITELRQKIGSKSIEIEKTPPLPLPAGRLRSNTPKIRPFVSRKRTPRRRDTIKVSSVSESLQECDEHHFAISNCDDKIARFEKLLKQMTDLYGSIETISETINQTAAVMDPLKKKGVPKIVSNIQLVPPCSTLQWENPTQDETDYCSDREG